MPSCRNGPTPVKLPRVFRPAPEPPCRPIVDHGPGGTGFPVENGRGQDRRGLVDRGPFPELDPPPGMDPDSPGAQRPRYSWNPADTTESFPAVGPDDIPLA